MLSNPPQITYQPWYNLIVAYPHEGELKLTPKLLVEKMRVQLDPNEHGFIKTANFRLQVRIHSVRSWNLTGRSLAMSIDDYSVRSQSDQEQICGIVDAGTALHVPACGFKIPVSLSNIVLRNDADDKDDVIVNIMAPTGNSCMTYVDVTWRFDGPIRAPTFRYDMQTLIGGVKAVKQNTSKIKDDLSEITGVIRSQLRSGYIDTIINGISKTAEVVAIAGASEIEDSLRELSESMRKLSVCFDNLETHGSSISMLEDVAEIPDED